MDYIQGYITDVCNCNNKLRRYGEQSDKQNLRTDKVRFILPSVQELGIGGRRKILAGCSYGWARVISLAIRVLQSAQCEPDSHVN